VDTLANIAAVERLAHHDERMTKRGKHMRGL